MNVPKSLAIIPDGNRRFAKRLMENPWKGHEWGAEKIRKLLDWCSEVNIRTVTVYVLSLENLESRPEEELKYLLALAKKEISDIMKKEGLPNIATLHHRSVLHLHH